MINELFLFANGNVAATDSAGEQMPEEQKDNLIIPLLRDKIKRGVVSASTELRMQQPLYAGFVGDVATYLHQTRYFTHDYVDLCIALDIIPLSM